MGSPQETHLRARDEAIRRFRAAGIEGSVVMLNLLAFRPVADYSDMPELAPPAPITGAEAYRRYRDHVRPYLQRAGSELLFTGRGGSYLIGPEHERWDWVTLVRHRSVEAFLGFDDDPGYRAGRGHRTAALADFRLLPVLE
ncbi:DUF1330 domain-containing protein [Haliangium sp.]|uniref:DUF1330 domain-containing protein n=1 Tax=Haliangium sp. TaxID=2663208 RepID=UPI003D0B5481